MFLKNDHESFALNVLKKYNARLCICIVGCSDNAVGSGGKWI
jgi:hypothetical protein